MPAKTDLPKVEINQSLPIEQPIEDHIEDDESLNDEDTESLNLEEVKESELFAEDLRSYQKAALELLANTDTVLYFDGKTPDDWAREQYINIPKDCSVKDIIELSVPLLENLAIAYRFQLAADAANDSIQTILKNQKIREVQKIVKEIERNNRRRPAKDHLEALAESRLIRTVGAANYIQARYNFWKGRVQYLIRVQEQLKNVGYLLTIESKTID